MAVGDGTDVAEAGDMVMVIDGLAPEGMEAGVSDTEGDVDREPVAGAVVGDVVGVAVAAAVPVLDPEPWLEGVADCDAPMDGEYEGLAALVPVGDAEPVWDAVIVGVAEPLAVDDKVPELLVDTLADGLSDTELEMDLVTLGEGDGDGAPLLVAEAEGD